LKKQVQIQRKETNVSVSEYISQQKENDSNGCSLIDNRSSSTLQKKENNTGLSDNLKSGIENLSGYTMDDVKVHYNSDKPAQLNAHAYAQGTDIHVASGQEKHIPHEAWHVVQQKQGRVQPTTAFNGEQINDNIGLETEADVMGEKALNTKTSNPAQLAKKDTTNDAPIQMFNKGVAAFGGLAGFVLAGANPLLGLGMALLGGGIGGMYGDNLFRDEEEPELGANLNLPIIDELDQRNRVAPQEDPLEAINELPELVGVLPIVDELDQRNQIIPQENQLDVINEVPELAANLDQPIVNELEQGNQIVPQENPLEVIDEQINEVRRLNMPNLTNTPTGEFVQGIVEDDYDRLPMNPRHLLVGTDSYEYPNMNMLRPILEDQLLEQEHNRGERELPTFLTGHLYNQAEEFEPERNRQFIRDFINRIPQEGGERTNYRVTLNHNMVNAWITQRRQGESFNDFAQRRYPPREGREYDGTRQEIRDLLNAGFRPTHTNGSKMTLGLN